MTTNRRSAGGPAPRAAAPRSWARPPGLALLILALVGLVQAGCRSDGCSTCGLGSKLTNGFNNGVQAVGRVFSHKDRGGVGCNNCGVGGGEEGVIVDSGMPYAPGAMVVPAPGTIVPAPSLESAPTELSPIENSGSASPTSGSGSASPKASGSGTGNTNPTSTRGAPANNRSAYEAYLPRGGAGRRPGNQIARALHSTPDPSARPAEPQGESANLFDNIPPVDLPSEFTRKVTPAPGPASTPTLAPTTAAPTAAEANSAAEGVAVASLPPSSSTSSPQAPGIRRSASVAPTIGGGSVPSVEGLDWLKEKGYKTFVDLRQGPEVEPTFAEAVNDRGMVYISLPILASRLDPSRVARFDALIAQSENRPIYFCDGDGTRAGLLWYLHLRAVEGEDSPSAAQKAEEIGLTNAQLKLAEAYLIIHKPKPRVAFAPRVPRPTELPEPEPISFPIEPAPAPAATIPDAATAPPSRPASASPAPDSEKAATSGSPDSPPMPTLPDAGRPQASRSPSYFSRDPASWKPVAALVLTGVGVPLAYWSRSALSVARTVRRASLPAAARRSLEAPAASDA